MKATLVGGPHDGREVEVRGKSYVALVQSANTGQVAEARYDWVDHGNHWLGMFMGFFAPATGQRIGK